MEFVIFKGFIKLNLDIKEKLIQIKIKVQSVLTVPIAEILSGKNARAWISMILYFKKYIEIKILKRKKNPGSRLEVAC